MFISIHSTWFELLLHNLMDQCGVVWRRSACGSGDGVWDGLHCWVVFLFSCQPRFCPPIRHSMVTEAAFGTFTYVGRYQVQLENEICISIKLVRRKDEML